MTQRPLFLLNRIVRVGALDYFNRMITFFFLLPPWLFRKAGVYTVNLALHYSLSCIFGVQNPQTAVKQSKIADIFVYSYSVVYPFLFFLASIFVEFGLV